MNWSIVKNDLKRNKVINLALLLFMMLSACLAVLSVLMAVQTFTSISDLYQTAQPPHFVQMHKGEIDPKQINRFMSDHNSVTFSQIDTMIDVYGENLMIVGKKALFDLSDCRLDIGLVKQNITKDLLLNADHETVALKEGEMGIPVLLKEMYGMEIGDHVILTANGIRREYVISSFILDSMMNSSMAASTRILIADKDYEELSGKVGEKEYLIEAYFNTPEEANDFKTAYQDAGLPQNGQAVTYSIIFIMSALTDIVTVFVLLLVSILLVVVSFLCVKYTIMAALEEEISEIGTLKAIGISFSDIRSLYLNKYRALAMVGVIVGYLLAILMSSVFTGHINTMFGNSTLSVLAVALSLLAAGVVFIFINFYCKKILSKIKKLTVVDALVSGNGFSNERGRVRDGLHQSKKLSVHWLLGLREVFYHFRSYVIVYAVVLIAVLMIMVPLNLLNTFEAPEFITYMGSSLEDILIEVENGEDLETGYEKVKRVLHQDSSIESYYEYRTVRVKTENAEKVLMNLDIDCGDNAGNGLQYLSGEVPSGENEIAISYLNANELNKQIGDTITLLSEQKEINFIISGIYQDVTSGGYTAKANNSFTKLAANKYSFSVNLNENISVEEKAEEWTDILGAGVSVDPMEEFINQTLGGVANQLRRMVFAVVIIGACLVMLITVLFLKLRLAKDLSEIAVLKAIGFAEADIRKQYMIKIGCVSAVGLLTGIIVTNALGEKIVNAALSAAGIGVKQVDLITNPVIQFILCPLLLMLLILLVTRIVMRTIKKYNIISVINE
jgi:putative ABC transport system permease protein